MDERVPVVHVVHPIFLSVREELILQADPPVSMNSVVAVPVAADRFQVPAAGWDQAAG